MENRRFFLVRHGETNENALGMVQGQLPGQLSDEGVRQAFLLAGRLKRVRFDAVYASDLKRAYRTAEIIVEGRDDASIIADPRLREQNFGIYEGKPVAELMRQMKRAGRDFATFTPDGGEGPAEFYKRVADFFGDVGAAGHKDVLLVTHYGVINALLRSLIYNESEGLPDQIIGNSAIAIVAIDGQGAAKIEAVNDIDHLKSR